MAVSFVNNAGLLSNAFDRVARMNDPQVANLQRFQAALPATSDVIRKEYTAGQVAKALGANGTDYNAAAQRAMALGDEETALKYAELYDRSLARKDEADYRNAILAAQMTKNQADAARAGRAEIKDFVKENPQIGTATSIQAMLKENESLYSALDPNMTREKYAAQSGAESNWQNFTRRRWLASPEQKAAMDKFDALKKQSVIELRQQMKGQGAITDQETNLLRIMEDANNPLEFERAGQALLNIWNSKTKTNAELMGLDASPYLREYQYVNSDNGGIQGPAGQVVSKGADIAQQLGLAI